MIPPLLYGIYTARFPYLDTKKHKISPVIVVSKPHGEYAIMAVIPITSRLIKEVVDVNLDGWEKAGLLKPSVARTHRLATLLHNRLITKIGSLSTNDIKKLQKSLRGYLEL